MPFPVVGTRSSDYRFRRVSSQFRFAGELAVPASERRERDGE